MRIATLQTAGKIIIGQQSLSSLQENLNTVGTSLQKALILASPSSRRLGYVKEIEKQLHDKNISSFINTGVLPEPTLENIQQIHKEVAANGYDFIIGIGGGSILDAAKILAVLKTNQQSIEEMIGVNQIEHPGIPLILIPTTSGTGAEVSPNAIVTIPEQQLKIGIVSSYLLPDLVILDAELTIDLPKSVTAATGMDAFTHALESYISNKANPISDMFALESIRLISSSIEASFFDGTNIDAREKMLIGSMYGGMALSSAGTAAVHALAYPLGGKFGISHGVANSMLLPHVMRFNKDAIEDRLTTVANKMGLNGGAEEVIQQIISWTEILEIPQDLKKYGVQAKDIENLANAASKVTRLLDNNPKKLEITDMQKIYANLI